MGRNKRLALEQLMDLCIKETYISKNFAKDLFIESIYRNIFFLIQLNVSIKKRIQLTFIPNTILAVILFILGEISFSSVKQNGIIRCS